MATVLACQKELNDASDETAALNRKMKLHAEDLSYAWQAREAQGIHVVMDALTRRLSQTAKELEELGHLVLITGQEILEEEATSALAAGEEPNGTD